MRELGQERWKKIKKPRFEFTFEDSKISPCLSRKAISSKFVLPSDKYTQKYTLWDECSLVNMAHIFRTPFLKNAFEWLLEKNVFKRIGFL